MPYADNEESKTNTAPASSSRGAGENNLTSGKFYVLIFFTSVFSMYTLHDVAVVAVVVYSDGWAKCVPTNLSLCLCKYYMHEILAALIIIAQ